MSFRVVHMPETWVKVDPDLADYFSREFERNKNLLEDTLHDGYEVKQITTVEYRDALWTTYLLVKY